MADEILCYLAEHPQAQDTVKGIAEWWLLEQRIVDTLRQVQGALDELAAENWLIVRQGLDGRVFYRLHPKALKKIQARMKRPRAGRDECGEDT